MGLFSLKDKAALLVGYEGNLGPIWCETLREAGAQVWSCGLPHHDFRADYAEWVDFLPMMTPEIMVCNAAIDTPPSVGTARFFTGLESTIQVNLTAHARVIEHYLPRMRGNGGAVIVLIGSIQGYIGADWRNYEGGFEKPVAYNLSKAALKQLARSLTVQYGRYGIRAVCPGFGPVITGKLPEEFLKKITDKIPIGRTVSEDSLKRTLLYACCCEDLAGEDWLVDGGYTAW